MFSVLAATHSDQQLKTVLILMFVIFAFLATVSIVLSFLKVRKKGLLLTMLYTATAIVLLFALFCLFRYADISSAATAPTEPSTVETTPPTTSETTTAPTETTAEPTEPAPTYTPQHTDDSDPANWDVKWEIFAQDAIQDTYQRPEQIRFGDGSEYFALPGIATFRGNNYRNGASYGTATVTEEKLSRIWGFDIGGLGYWTGSGWTGQALMVQWDEETKATMNLYDDKKAKEDLVEVIHATLDGKIYFYDLDDGNFTRPPVNIGMPFKGAGALDPRGYPMMYVGAGDFTGGTPSMFVISLIDGSILYKQSGADEFRERNWCSFDSSPLVDAETDTLIWPGESGVLYTIKLNTNYDKAAGALSVEPENVVRTRYSNKKNLWVGYEASAVIVDRYLYVSENGGMFHCVDLDTMELVWAQDTKDDSNSSPVFQWENGKGYIYTAPSLHWTASGGYGSIPICKLDAQTGQIVWQTDFDCQTVKDVSGGVQASPLLGKAGTELEGLIIYPVARMPRIDSGMLVALDTATGEIVWQMPMEAYS